MDAHAAPWEPGTVDGQHTQHNSVVVLVVAVIVATVVGVAADRHMEAH